MTQSERRELGQTKMDSQFASLALCQKIPPFLARVGISCELLASYFEGLDSSCNKKKPPLWVRERERISLP